MTTPIPELDSAPSVRMFPNPTSGLLTIALDGEKTILFSNLAGQIIKKINTDANTISLENLSPGLYVVTVLNFEKRQVARRLIVFEK